MTNNFNLPNQVPYLRTSREFPEDGKKLTLEINKSYVDIANAVNARTIGIFTTNKSLVTGESWFLNGQRQQGLRQVYTFNSTSSITHGIPVPTITQFTNGYGTYTDGTNSYGLIYGTNVAIAGQISFYLTTTQIVFNVGAGAPALSSGRLVIEWIVLT